MTDRSRFHEQLWEKGWDGHEKAQLKRMAQLSFQEKITWLEEAQEMLKGMNHEDAKSAKKYKKSLFKKTEN